MKVSAAFGRCALVVCGLCVGLLCAASATAEDPVERVVSLVSQGKFPEARAALEPLLKRHPNAPRLRLIDGILQARRGQTAEAISLFESLRADRTDMFEVYNNLGVLYAGQGRLDDARKAFVAALERRSDATAHANLGDVLTWLAARAYARARDLAGGSVPPPAPRDHPPPQVSAEESSPESQGPAAAVPNTGDAIRVPSRKPAAPSASSQRCLHAGRFKDRAAAAKSAEWSQRHGAELLEIHHERHRVVENYRVYLPAAANAQETDATLRELRDRGLHDIATIAKGPMAGRISVGLYKIEQNAGRRVAQLRKLGYAAKSAANTKMLSHYAVRMRIGRDRTAFDAAWKGRFLGHPVRYIECP